MPQQTLQASEKFIVPAQPHTYNLFVDNLSNTRGRYCAVSIGANPPRDLFLIAGQGVSFPVPVGDDVMVFNFGPGRIQLDW